MSHTTKKKFISDYGDTFAPGTRLGRFVILDEIGTSGMGAVYRAAMAGHRSQVALKLLATDFTEVDGLYDYLRLVANRDIIELKHTAINPLLKVGMVQNHIYLANEYLTGGTAQQKLLSAGMLDTQVVLKLLKEIAHGLSYLHQLGHAHLNLKPSNILFDSNDRAYLGDIGIAPLLEAAAQTFLLGGARLTTPAYLAPEQINGRDISPQTDIYALSAVAFALLTGAPPYDASDPQELYELQYSQPIPNAREINPKISQNISDALKVGMSFSRTARFETIAEMMTAISGNMPYELAPSDTLPYEIATPQVDEAALEEALRQLGISRPDVAVAPEEIEQTSTLSPISEEGGIVYEVEEEATPIGQIETVVQETVAIPAPAPAPAPSVWSWWRNLGSAGWVVGVLAVVGLFFVGSLLGGGLFGNAVGAGLMTQVAVIAVSDDGTSQSAPVFGGTLETNTLTQTPQNSGQVTDVTANEGAGVQATSVENSTNEGESVQATNTGDSTSATVVLGSLPSATQAVTETLANSQTALVSTTVTPETVVA